MTAFLIRRLMQSAMVVVIMSLVVFFGVNVVGDPVDMLVSSDATQEEIDAVIKSFGLDRPVWEQYWRFIVGAASGDLGNSFVHGTPALPLILERMPATMELAFFALFLAIVIGIPLGLYAGLKPRAMSSRAIMAGSILGFSLPTFWVGLMLIIIFAVMLGWLPSTGRGDTAVFLGIESSLFTWDGLKHVMLPALNLALLKISLVIRLTRAGTREAIFQDYIRTARAKGMAEGYVVRTHLLRNIMIPVVTVLGLEFGGLIAFSVVTETIFAWPGMGKLLIESIQQLDRPVIVAYLIIIVLFFVFINFVVDVMYAALDPRVRLGDQKS